MIGLSRVANRLQLKTPQIRAFGEPLMLFTGGDPLKRPDIFDLIRYSATLGLRTNITPSATPC
jgi:MoaA/NifB/PqqE/SkfB family radical SAM enzyme